VLKWAQSFQAHTNQHANAFVNIHRN